MVTMESTQALTTPIEDFATKNGTYVILQKTVGQYLDLLALYDHKTHATNWDVAIAVSFQRALLPIHKNPIKRRMLRDLLRGSTLPPIVLYEREEQRPQVVDGLQRTHVLTEALKTLLALEQNEQPKERFAKEELDAMKDLNQVPIKVEEFLDRPVVLQVWHKLEPDELVRLFMILNVGQQKVSPRHLLEVMGDDVRRMFEEWGLKVVSEPEEKQQPRRRGRPAAGDDNTIQSKAEKLISIYMEATGCSEAEAKTALAAKLEEQIKSSKDAVVPGITHYRYEYLLDGLFAYVTRDPQVKTTKILQEEMENPTPNLALEERITEVGSENCRADFVWVCKDLNEVFLQRYDKDPRWRLAIQNSDNFFIPLMAALGNARHNERARAALEDRKKKLIELIRASRDPDPLSLSRGDVDSLGTILDNIKSNIGRKQRGVVYNAWRRYFLLGAEDPAYAIEWRTALLSD